MSGLDLKTITEAAPGRSCGQCSLCCFLLDVPEAGKPKSGWCPHARPGKGGCAIHESRPGVCRTYNCQWLVDATIPDRWQPLKCKMLLDYSDSGSGDGMVLGIHVHPQFANRWREEPYYTDIREAARRGLDGSMPGFYRTMIFVFEKVTHLVLPGGAVPAGPGAVLRVGENEWKFVPTKNDEEARMLVTNFQRGSG